MDDRHDNQTGQINSIKVCKACRKPIHINARLCPYCYSQQQANVWHTLSVFMQWSAGAVTIVSLIVAIHSLSGFYFNWIQKNRTVDELVDAAHLLEKMDYFSHAWNMIDDAINLNSGDPVLTRYQVDLAMHWLRSKSERFSIATGNVELADKVTPVLYRALVTADKERSADVYAHIGLAQLLKRRNAIVVMDVERLFSRALQYNHNNIYAHTFKGYWLLLAGMPGETSYQEAIQHFESAQGFSKNQFEKAWVDSWYLYGLNRIRVIDNKQVAKDVASRMIRLASLYYKQNRTIDDWRLRANIVRLLGGVRDVSPEIEYLIDVLPPQEGIGSIKHRFAPHPKYLTRNPLTRLPLKLQFSLSDQPKSLK
ncbi:hypothetical protein FT643_22905, partial [Ketobacter sp. MCCC 1A13808]|uniref:hypothetical protein n=1 Tax=Ketobacter sp. MCCC 1A13808 TaxID=2602738 RepID=UPI0012EC6235